MNTLRWLRKNGDIIGCEENGLEYTVYAIIESEDQRLHRLYHIEMNRTAGEKKSKEGGGK